MLKHDGKVAVATGRSRKDLHWKNREILWSELVKKLAENHRTAESYKEYMSAKKPRRDEIKDIGGFVGGVLSGGRRKKDSVTARSIVTLDADFAETSFWEDFCMLYNNAAVCYSTHSHSNAKPRLRFICPLTRELLPDEYEPVARKIADSLGIDQFDDTTYQPERLMYWPSSSKDGDVVYETQDGPWFDPDKILQSYRDWRDSSQWPTSGREHDVVRREIKKQEDPLSKPGIVGAFCRCFSISEAIEKYLPDLYEATDVPGRYTYTQGSTAAGLVVYDDKFAYSHHGTDPVSMKLCNSFDLVRLHLYGALDEDAKEGTPVNKLPSYTKMVHKATEDPVVRTLIITEKAGQAAIDFEEVELEADEWLSKLKVDKRGNVLNGLDNVVTILENDSQLKGCFFFDEFEQRERVQKDLPWRKLTPESRYMQDKDISNFKYFLKKKYDISIAAVAAEDAYNVIYQIHRRNPLREYLSGLVWDGVGRIDTLLRDYLGADESPLIAAITRKTLVAAVTRAFRPGAKFDYMLMLIGVQGLGKSTLIKKLGQQWFTESFHFGMLSQGNKAYEALQGAWLVESGELSGFKKAEMEAAKSFLSATEDRYRVSYGRRVSFFPRTCIFFGTTNESVILRDQTGNRRYWPVRTDETKATKSVWDMTQADIDQIWAEAMQFYRDDKETLYLSREDEKEMNHVRSGFTETDEREGLIRKYLETLLPSSWADMNVYQRRGFLNGDNEIQEKGWIPRDKVCAAEIWCEVLGGNVEKMTSYSTKFIHDIMGKIDGWKRTVNPLRFSIYGRQKGYVNESELISQSVVTKDKKSDSHSGNRSGTGEKDEKNAGNDPATNLPF